MEGGREEKMLEAILEPLQHPTPGGLNSAGRPQAPTRAPTSDATAGKVRPGLWRALDPSRTNPWAFRSICAARVDDSAPEMLIPLGTAPPHQFAAIDLTRKPRGPGSWQEGEARTPLQGSIPPFPVSRVAA